MFDSMPRCPASCSQASWLDHAIAGADPNLRELIMQAIQQTRANSTMSFADVVRGALHQMVLSGTSSAENVALLFGMHERTLRKRLTAERTSLQQLVSQTRFELAKQLLENTRSSFVGNRFGAALCGRGGLFPGVPQLVKDEPQGMARPM